MTTETTPMKATFTSGEMWFIFWLGLFSGFIAGLCI